MINLIQFPEPPGGYNMNELRDEAIRQIAQAMMIQTLIPRTEEANLPVKEEVEEPKTQTEIILDWMSSQDLMLSGNKLAEKLKADNGISVSGAYINKLKKM